MGFPSRQSIRNAMLAMADACTEDPDAERVLIPAVLMVLVFSEAYWFSSSRLARLYASW